MYTLHIKSQLITNAHRRVTDNSDRYTSNTDQELLLTVTHIESSNNSMNDFYTQYSLEFTENEKCSVGKMWEE